MPAITTLPVRQAPCYASAETRPFTAGNDTSYPSRPKRDRLFFILSQLFCQRIDIVTFLVNWKSFDLHGILDDHLHV